VDTNKVLENASEQKFRNSLERKVLYPNVLVLASTLGFKLGMCGMDFSSSVRFRFGFDKNRGFGSVSVSVRF